MFSSISSATIRFGPNGRNGDWQRPNDIVYAELSVRYATIEELDAMLRDAQLVSVPIPRAALFLAGKAFQRYRSTGGVKTGVLPDFFIGAHAVVSDSVLVTRDAARYPTYFPGVKLIAPN